MSYQVLAHWCNLSICLQWLHILLKPSMMQGQINSHSGERRQLMAKVIPYCGPHRSAGLEHRVGGGSQPAASRLWPTAAGVALPAAITCGYGTLPSDFWHRLTLVTSQLFGLWLELHSCPFSSETSRFLDCYWILGLSDMQPHCGGYLASNSKSKSVSLLIKLSVLILFLQAMLTSRDHKNHIQKPCLWMDLSQNIRFYSLSFYPVPAY